MPNRIAHELNDKTAAVNGRGAVFLDWTRRVSAVCGAVALLALAFSQEGELSGRLAFLAFVAFAMATSFGWLQLLSGSRLRRPIGRDEKHSSKRWWLATIAVALMAGLLIQTWFRPGTSIAAGDLTPPEGTAWLARLFEPWTWNGTNLGGPSQLPLQLPWAVVLGIVHWAGGSPELAQRIWYTTLFVSAGLGALGLLAALRMGPGAALIGAAVYLFNPYVVSVVSINPVYIASLGLLAAMPALVLAAGTGQLSVRVGAGLVVLAAPMFGYVDMNPPLVGMVLGSMLAAPFLAGLLEGKGATFRAMSALALAIPLLLLASAYWIVPAFLYLPHVASAQLASVSSWSWTEARATIRNAFWLNTSWAWSFPEYNPYATAYDVLPLSLMRFVLPAIAFGALALRHVARGADGLAQRDRRLCLTVTAATGATVIVFLSTGTNPPGSLAFDVLYHLPLGWLLREPGRFLMVVALAYAVLIAVVVEASHSRPVTIDLKKLTGVLAWVSRGWAAPLALGTALSLGFPLWTGAIVADSRPMLPPVHVTVPSYWKEMAGFVDALPTKGALLVMPPDAFYQVPYKWGYYGADGFIVDLFHRPVLVPNGQGYSPASAQVVNAVSLTAQSILDHDWRQVDALVRALNTPLILVRRDLDTTFPGRAILSPNDLALALSASPNFDLVRTAGSLELFVLRGTIAESEGPSTAVMINSPMPDLRLLSLLGPNMALVSGAVETGLPYAVQAPPPEMLQDSGDGLVWQASAPQGWSYTIADLSSKTVVSMDHVGDFTLGVSGARVVYAQDATGHAVTVSVTGRRAISNGDFSQGLWGPVGDCYDLLGARAKPYLHADIVPHAAPGGQPAMRLSASADSTCQSQRLDWHGGPIVLSLMVHPVRGDAPRVCLWEVGPSRCATLPSIPETTNWSVYRAAAIPDPETTAIDIFLYADFSGTETIDEYANVRVVELPALPSFALLANPDAQAVSPPDLDVLHNSFSTDWGSTNGSHVVVDGMLNGWLFRSGSHPLEAAYMPTNILRAAQWISILTWLITLLIPVWVLITRLAGNRRSSRPWNP